MGAKILCLVSEPWSVGDSNYTIPVSSVSPLSGMVLALSPCRIDGHLYWGFGFYFSKAS